MTLADAVADEVRRRMARRGLSAREVARRAGMPATLLHRALAGTRPLQLDELEHVAEVLGVRPEHVVRVAAGRGGRVTRTGERSESNSEPRQE